MRNTPSLWGNKAERMCDHGEQSRIPSDIIGISIE